MTTLKRNTFSPSRVRTNFAKIYLWEVSKQTLLDILHKVAKS